MSQGSHLQRSAYLADRPRSVSVEIRLHPWESVFYARMRVKEPHLGYTNDEHIRTEIRLSSSVKSRRNSARGFSREPGARLCRAACVPSLTGELVNTSADSTMERKSRGRPAASARAYSYLTGQNPNLPQKRARKQNHIVIFNIMVITNSILSLQIEVN